jgi:hypothetical protein
MKKLMAIVVIFLCGMLSPLSQNSYTWIMILLVIQKVSVLGKNKPNFGEYFKELVSTLRDWHKLYSQDLKNDLIMTCITNKT